MKSLPSKIVFWFTLVGFSLGLLNLLLGVASGWINSPGFHDALSHFYIWFVLVCPFAAGDMALERLHHWPDIAWVYLEVILFNTLLYLLLGAIFASFVWLLKRWQESPAGTRR